MSLREILLYYFRVVIHYQLINREMTVFANIELGFITKMARLASYLHSGAGAGAHAWSKDCSGSGETSPAIFCEDYHQTILEESFQVTVISV